MKRTKSSPRARKKTVATKQSRCTSLEFASPRISRIETIVPSPQRDFSAAEKRYVSAPVDQCLIDAVEQELACGHQNYNSAAAPSVPKKMTWVEFLRAHMPRLGNIKDVAAEWRRYNEEYERAEGKSDTESSDDIVPSPKKRKRNQSQTTAKPKNNKKRTPPAAKKKNAKAVGKSKSVVTASPPINDTYSPVWEIELSSDLRNLRPNQLASNRNDDITKFVQVMARLRSKIPDEVLVRGKSHMAGYIRILNDIMYGRFVTAMSAITSHGDLYDLDDNVIGFIEVSSHYLYQNTGTTVFFARACMYPASASDPDYIPVAVKMIHASVPMFRRQHIHGNDTDYSANCQQQHYHSNNQGIHMPSFHCCADNQNDNFASYFTQTPEDISMREMNILSQAEPHFFVGHCLFAPSRPGEQPQIGIVTRLVAGTVKDLYEIPSRISMTTESLVYLFVAILKCFETLCRSRIAYSDMKPGNLFLSEITPPSPLSASDNTAESGLLPEIRVFIGDWTPTFLTRYNLSVPEGTLAYAALNAFDPAERVSFLTDMETVIFTMYETMTYGGYGSFVHVYRTRLHTMLESQLRFAQMQNPQHFLFVWPIEELRQNNTDVGWVLERELFGESRIHRILESVSKLFARHESNAYFSVVENAKKMLIDSLIECFVSNMKQYVMVQPDVYPIKNVGLLSTVYCDLRNLVLYFRDICVAEWTINVFARGAAGRIYLAPK